jgi:hypothetical protein
MAGIWKSTWPSPAKSEKGIERKTIEVKTIETKKIDKIE